MSDDAGLEVDLVVLSRTAEPLRAAFQQGIAAQSRAGVMPRLVRVIGAPRPEETHRWQTIARARNEGFALSAAPWVMFLDDDVILDSGCVRRLADGLRARPGFAALAADYLGESTAHGAWSRPDRHIAMGATLFRRAALSQIRFRAEPNKCECLCCCDDLRRLGLAIAYLPEARAWHNRTEVDHARPDRGCDHRRSEVAELPGRVLAAFDRRHLERFRRQFLGSLRAAGNDEPVTAVGYGLYPSEQRILARTPGFGAGCAAGWWRRCRAAADPPPPRLCGRRRELAGGDPGGLLGCRRRDLPEPAGNALDVGPIPSRQADGRPRARVFSPQPGGASLDHVDP